MVLIDLEKYQVSKEAGFLPSELPLEKLPQLYYQPWETLVANLPSLIFTKRLRKLVDKLPVLSIEHLVDIRQLRRGYQVLGFLAHGYIWGDDMATNKLPESLASPLIKISEILRLPPLATYAGLCLWNFKQIIPDPENLWDLDNLTTINTYTGGIDESWFYLVSVYFEYKSSFTINTGLDILNAIEKNDVPTVTRNLQKLAEMIDHLGTVLMKMEEMCDPHIFYFRIRPYLAGWRNMSDVGLDKNGVIYGNDPKPKSFAGGSNAQSSSIQFLDALLNVVHHPTGERPLPHETGKKQAAFSGEPSNNFMSEMRDYMPGPHKDFLEHIESVSNVKQYVQQHGDENPELTLSYDACLAMLKLFRDKHIQIVTRYIILQAKKGSKLGSSSTLRSGLAKSKKKETEQTGTGGTSLLPFLKQCRDETGDPAAGNWGKRILSDGVMRLNFSRPNGINED